MVLDTISLCTESIDLGGVSKSILFLVTIGVSIIRSLRDAESGQKRCKEWYETKVRLLDVSWFQNERNRFYCEITGGRVEVGYEVSVYWWNQNFSQVVSGLMLEIEQHIGLWKNLQCLSADLLALQKEWLNIRTGRSLLNGLATEISEL